MKRHLTKLNEQDSQEKIMNTKKNEDWKLNIDGCFGETDLKFAGHPNSEARAKRVMREAFAAGASIEDVETAIRDFLASKKAAASHIKGQIQEVRRFKFGVEKQTHIDGLRVQIDGRDLLLVLPNMHLFIALSTWRRDALTKQLMGLSTQGLAVWVDPRPDGTLDVHADSPLKEKIEALNLNASSFQKILVTRPRRKRPPQLGS